MDLLDAADAIGRALSGISFDQFVDQGEKRDAVLWNLMIIGEASTRFSKEVTDERPDVPWELIRGFRNRVVHGYFALEWPIVWHIAKDEVPGLRQHAELLLAKKYAETHRRWKERPADGRPVNTS